MSNLRTQLAQMIWGITGATLIAPEPTFPVEGNRPWHGGTTYHRSREIERIHLR